MSVAAHPATAQGQPAPSGPAAWWSRLTPRVALRLLVVVLVLLGPLFVTGTYYRGILSMAGIWAILGISLNVAWGYAGLLSIGHGALFGIGAYSAGLLTTRYDQPFLLALVVALVLPALAGAVLGAVTLRMGGIYFALGTVALGVVVEVVLERWVDFTRGPHGVSGIPSPGVEIAGLRIGFDTPVGRYYIVLAAVALCVWLCARLLRSPVGLAWMGLRENPDLAAFVGVSQLRWRMAALVLSGAMAGGAGALFAVSVTFILPETASFWTGFNGLVFAIVGGAGSLVGPVLGALTLTLLPEWFREIADYRVLLFGVFLVVVVAYFRQGLIGIPRAIGDAADRGGSRLRERGRRREGST